MYPPLSKDHKVLGQEYCSGYTDSFGKWNTGFYCPPVSPDSPIVYCCGTPDNKYCCINITTTANFIKPSLVEMETEIEISSDYEPISRFPPSPDIGRNSYIAAVICGLVVVTILMTLVSCFYCSCCLLYKKRRTQLSGGLYRIPASSTTCGLINSANGLTSPSSSLVTTPLNPVVFTTTNWTNPLQGQLLRTNPRMPPQPQNTQGSLVNTTLYGERSMSSSNTSSLPTVQDRLATMNNNGPNNCNPQPPRYNQVPLGPINNYTTNIPSTNISHQLQRHLSLLQQHNPNLLRTICNANSNNNSGNSHSQRYSRNHCDIPTIYTTGRSNNNTTIANNSGATGTIHSIISSVTNSATSSSSSLPPPYFIEQYRIRNRIRQPRNVSPVVLLPSYNETQRETRLNDERSRSSCGIGQVTTMNDLSAPTRQQNHDRNSRSRSRANNQSEPMSNNLPVVASPCPNPRRIENLPQTLPGSLDKILNTVTLSSIQRTSNEASKSREQPDLPREISSLGRKHPHHSAHQIATHD